MARGENPAVSHKFRWTVNGIVLEPTNVQTSALGEQRRTVETSEPHFIVTDVAEPQEFTATFNSDDEVGLTFLRLWLDSRIRPDSTLQLLDNDGAPILAYVLKKTALSALTPTADLNTVEPERIDIQGTFHAIPQRLL